MTGIAPDAVIRGTVSPDGRLIAADEPLLALQRDAGGTMDGPLVIPALAHLVRVAGRLGVTIARPVVVGGKDQDIALWVRLKPTAEGVDIAIIRQHEDAASRHERVDFAAIAAHAEMAREGWSWQVDRHLQFRVVNGEDSAVDHVLPRIGEPLSVYFRLLESEAGASPEALDPLPMLAAVAAGRPFSGQRAVLRGEESTAYSLAGLPMFDGRGRLTGYRGKARPMVEAATAPATEEQAQDGTGYNPAFSRKLDNALRQPLGRIVANANTISGQLEGPLRADYAAYAADIAAAGRHLLALVDDLADLQAIERPDFTAARERVELADLARRAAGLLKMRAAERHIAIKAPKEGEKVAATAEYRRVLQILVNLIGNAVRYSPDDSQVSVRVVDDSQAECVRVTVADQGQGIDAADHERIFARFERLTPDDGAGSGLGLYISRRLARAMGGDISVQSALGQGARFTLTLPRYMD